MEFLEKPEELTLNISDQDLASADLIKKQLIGYVEKHVGPSTYRELVITLNDSNGQMVGGLHGQSNWQWLFVQRIFVSEEHRYKGIGSQLMKAAENEARRRSCVGVWLDTFSFQSPDFYKKLGYQQFGTIPDYPWGHNRQFFFKKFR